MVAFIMTFSAHLNKIGDKLNQLPHFILLCLHVLLPVGLITLQGNTGSSVIMLLIFLTMLFSAGLSWKYITFGLVSVPVLGYVFWNFYAKDYQKLRILVIFDKEIQQQEVMGLFHQQNQSLIALGSGGLTGQGVKGGEYISFFAIHNDFIFAYIGMTLGFVGCILVLLLLVTICAKILSVAGASKDLLGRLICVGVFALFFSHSVINVGMATALTPVVGIPLPLISAGGSSTLSLYCAIGLVLNVWAHKEKKYHMFYTEKD
jgi:rod shape determining protein RodA